MAKRGGFKTEHIQEKQVIQAVVICDNYSNSLAPIIFSKPSALIPLGNRPFLDYTLEFLASAGVEEVILFSSTHSHLIKKYIKQSLWSNEHSPMSLSVVVSETCRSLGDAMRDLYAKGLIRGDFILLYGTTVANVPLIPLLEKFRLMQQRDKGAVIAPLFQKAGDGYKTFGERKLILTDVQSSRLFTHQPIRTLESQFILPETVVNSYIYRTFDFLTDYRETGIWLCSSTVPSLFEDNFDYECVDDLIRGILLEDEVIQYSVYMFTVPKNKYASSVLAAGWPAFQTISYDVIHRLTFPVVPDSQDYFIKEPYTILRNNIYKQGAISFSAGCTLAKNVVVASNCVFGADSVITQSVLGRNCEIGQNVTVRDSFLWDNVVVEDNCHIEGSVLAEGCHVGADVTLPTGCVLGPGVRVHKGQQFTKHLRLVAEPCFKYSQELSAWKQISEHAWIVPRLGDDDDSDDESEPPTIGRLNSVSTEEENGSAEKEDAPPTDDATQFYTEVLDSLVRGFEDRLPPENLCLEINSSRYAYNVAAGDVTWHVIRAILQIPEHLAVQKGAASPLNPGTYMARLQPPLGHLLPVLSNYIRNADVMNTCLKAIEDLADSVDYLRPCMQKLLHILYHKDIIDEPAIMKWYNSPADPKSTLAQDIRKQVTPFINWLSEADEESSDD